MNTNKIFGILALTTMTLFSGCSLFKNEKKDSAVLVVNVLSKNLYDDCHIPGSIQVDFNDIVKASDKWSKNTKIIVYCANYSCSASASAVRSLREKGFDAYEYAAGMAGWKQAGFPVEGSAVSPYLTQGNEEPVDVAHDIPVVSTQELYTMLNNEQQGQEK